jgi:glycosyltransferase involved in cell wall biosynthesis
MIVKNEQSNLPRCLESVKDIVDEMIIVDTGSSDSTIEIAESYNAKVYSFPWNGSFSDARNYGLKKASCDWFLIMDADDEMDKASHSTVRELIENSGDDIDAYYGESISYLGAKVGDDTVLNMNLRLVRNGRGYFFSQAVHEQLWSNIYAVNPSAKILEGKIRVYHYGYMTDELVFHNKRARNMELLEKQLEENPDNGFINFNMANEYSALGDNLKALTYYKNAYKNFNPNEGFASKLLLRMIVCYQGLGRDEDFFRISKEALQYYPDFTDIEFMNGILYASLNRYTLAVKSFKKCVDMGEAPNQLRVIIGSGTFKPCQILADIYCSLEDYSEAEIWYKKALEFKKDLFSAFKKLIKIYCLMKQGQNELEASIEKMRFVEYDDFDSIVFNVLMEEKYYDLAMEYIKKYEKRHGSTPFSRYSKGVCKFCLRNFTSAYNIMQSIKKYPEFIGRAVCIQALCKVIQKDYTQALEILSDESLSPEDGLIIVYREFVRMLQTGNVPLLSNDEKISSVLTIAIMDVLSVLLGLHELELFEKALCLFNSVNDKTVILRLAKLYYNEKCFDLAYKELMHSVKDFGLIDAEAANMLFKLKQRGF